MHVPRLEQALAALLAGQRAAALGTLDAQAGTPFVSMVPFAVDAAGGCLVLHVSGLAAHTGNMAAQPAVSLLVTAPQEPGAPVHDLARVTLEGTAGTPEPGSDAWRSARAAYLVRFPDVEPMTELPDFRFVLDRSIDFQLGIGNEFIVLLLCEEDLTDHIRHVFGILGR